MGALGWVIMSNISISYMVFADKIGLIVSTGDINYSTLMKNCDKLLDTDRRM